MRVVHLSDFHLCSTFDGRDKTLIDRINSYKGDLTVISGDLSNRGESPGFGMFEDFLDELQGDRLVIQGNHDRVYNSKGDELFERLIRPKQQFDENGMYEREHKGKKYLFCTLQTCYSSDNGEKIYSSCGNVSKENAQELEKRLESIDADVKSLVIHHPFIRDGFAPLLQSFRPIDLACEQGFDYVFVGHSHSASFCEIRYAGHKPFWQLNAGSISAKNIPPGTLNSFAVYDHFGTEHFSVRRVDIDYKAGTTFKEIDIEV